MGKRQLTYDILADQLDNSQTDSAEKFIIYESMSRHTDELIKEFKQLLANDLREQDGRIACGTPSFLDEFAAPMDNLTILYIKRGEYEKAATLIEKILPIYRTLEIRNPNFTYQRYYAMERLIKCYQELGKEDLAILYEFEATYLCNDVLSLQLKTSE